MSWRGKISLLRSTLEGYSMNTAKIRKPLELTLAILKPDICRNPQEIQMIRQIMLENNFYFVKTDTTRLSKERAERFYEEHRNKFFFGRLVSFMSSGVISLHVLARENAIQHWRKLMGPTKVFKAQYEAPESIRARFGLTDTRNATHGADSPDSARREIGFFFPNFDVAAWYKNEELMFRSGQVTLDQENWVHNVAPTTPIIDLSIATKRPVGAV
uniref:Nucleoside diphosphate kinase 6 n=1 Tax=Hadrurus spadix TaxID=141984 RepID=A0A1W7RA72_9SCOR